MKQIILYYCFFQQIDEWLFVLSSFFFNLCQNSNTSCRITGGELFDKITEIGAYSEQTAAQLVTNIVSAVKYLHDRGIAHRDLKVYSFFSFLLYY